VVLTNKLYKLKEEKNEKDNNLVKDNKIIINVIEGSQKQLNTSQSSVSNNTSLSRSKLSISISNNKFKSAKNVKGSSLGIDTTSSNINIFINIII
jgi:hypothetical protein